MKLFATIAALGFATTIGVPTVIQFVAGVNTVMASLATMGAH